MPTESNTWKVEAAITGQNDTRQSIDISLDGARILKKTANSKKKSRGQVPVLQTLYMDKDIFFLPAYKANSTIPTYTKEYKGTRKTIIYFTDISVTADSRT